MGRATSRYERLKPPAPTPKDEICSCPPDTPIKLMSMRQVDGFNPIRCLNCNLEVPPERFEFADELVEAIAAWDWQHGALLTLELASGEYEGWARSVLLDPNSSTNVEGRNLAGRLSDHASCYFWFFQPQADKDWHPAAACPVCREPLDRYESGIFLQLLCQTDRLVLVG